MSSLAGEEPGSVRGSRSGLEDSSLFSGAGPGKRPQEGGSRFLESGSGRQGSQRPGGRGRKMRESPHLYSHGQSARAQDRPL